MNKSEKQRALAEQRFFEEFKDTLFFQIHRVNKAFFKNGSNLIQQAGIDLQVEQLPVLIIIDTMKNISQQEIADLLQRDKSSVLRSVTSLQKKGLVNIEQDPADKRRNVVTLTVEGKAMATRTKSVIRKADEAASAAFTNMERADAIGFLSRIADKLERL